MSSMTTDNEPVTAYVPPAYKQKLKEFAESQERSVSFIAAKVLKEFVDNLIKSEQVKPFTKEDDL